MIDRNYPKVSRWREWAINVLKRSFKEINMVNDVEFPKEARKTRRVIIAGAGQSLKKIFELDLKHAFVVANQSSLKYLIDNKVNVDLVVLMDGNLAAAQKLTGMVFKTGYCGPVIAGLHVDPMMDRMQEVFYMPMFLDGNKIFNGIIGACYPRAVGSIYQVGTVVGASVLVANVLMMTKKIPEAPIILVGVDLAYGKAGTKKLYEHINEELGEAPKEYLVRDDEILDEVFAIYEDQLKIVEQNTNIPLFIHNPGSRLTKFIKEWKL